MPINHNEAPPGYIAKEFSFSEHTATCQQCDLYDQKRDRCMCRHAHACGAFERKDSTNVVFKRRPTT